MFYNFNAHRARKTTPGPSTALARQIFEKLIGLQRRWADFMQAQTQRLTRSWLIAFSLTAMIASGAYSTYLISDGLFSARSHAQPYGLKSPWPAGTIKRKQLPAKQNGLSRYLDSVRKAAYADSKKTIQP